MKNGISEHYDSVTDKALGVADYCMSCTLATMMLDGLTHNTGSACTPPWNPLTCNTSHG